MSYETEMRALAALPAGQWLPSKVEAVIAALERLGGARTARELAAECGMPGLRVAACISREVAAGRIVRGGAGNKATYSFSGGRA